MISPNCDDAGVWGVSSYTRNELVEVVDTLLGSADKFTPLGKCTEGGEIDHITDETNGVWLEFVNGPMEETDGARVSVGGLEVACDKCQLSHSLLSSSSLKRSNLGGWGASHKQVSDVSFGWCMFIAVIRSGGPLAFLSVKC